MCFETHRKIVTFGTAAAPHGVSRLRFRFSNTLHGDLLFDDGVAIIQVEPARRAQTPALRAP